MVGRIGSLKREEQKTIDRLSLLSLPRNRASKGDELSSIVLSIIHLYT